MSLHHDTAQQGTTSVASRHSNGQATNGTDIEKNMSFET